MKVLAMYLPQFHQVKENDEWWGEGFTEWTAVRNAHKYYKEHKQPRIPLNNNYYNLLDKKTLEWQSSLMKKYEIDGLCMYHYWFKEGRQILERPAENLLHWTDIDIPFCFCWANETWARSWSNIHNKNTWADIYEKQHNGEGILLEQKYGREKQWKDHFEYLLSFFQDNRYIKIDGKPLFLFYKTSEIFCLSEMIDYWEQLSQLYGLPGIYFVGSGSDLSENAGIKAVLHYQPAMSRSNIPKSWNYTKSEVNILEYDDVWNSILTEKIKENIFLEGVVGYDDTPRRGVRGCVIEHATPEKFTYYLTELLAKSASYGTEIVFINAWNEWGEGMYLEPDEEYGESYLSAIPYAKSNYKYRIEKYKNIQNIDKGENKKVTIEEYKKQAKDTHYLHLLDKWMLLRENGFSVAEWIKKQGWKNIAVYGYGILGKHLCNDLCSHGIVIEYIIDQLGKQLHTNYKVYLPSDILPDTEVIIVSATYDYEKIYTNLDAKGNFKIVSLEGILYEN